MSSITRFNPRDFRSILTKIVQRRRRRTDLCANEPSGRTNKRDVGQRSLHDKTMVIELELLQHQQNIHRNSQLDKNKSNNKMPNCCLGNYCKSPSTKAYVVNLFGANE